MRQPPAPALLLVSLLAGPAADAEGPPPELPLASGVFRPLDAPTARAETSPGGVRYLVAIVSGPLGAAERARLEETGARVLGFLPRRGYRLSVPPDAEASLRRLPFVAWLGPLPATSKLLPGASAGPVRVVLEVGEGPERVQALLPGARAAQALPGGEWRMTGSASATDLLRIAALPEVAAIEPVRPVRLLNQDAVWVHQSFVGPSPQSTPLFQQGIYGCGEIVGVADTAQDHDACWFRDAVNGPPPVFTCSAPPCPAGAPSGNRRKDIAYYNWSGGATGEEDTCPASTTGSSGHGTHTSGSVAGDNAPYADCAGRTTAGRSGGDGQAPGAKLVFHELGDGLEYLNDLGGTYGNVLDVAWQNGARIHSVSWAGACHDAFGTCIPGCTLPYDSLARDADLAMWTHPDLLVVTAAGNAGASCPAPLAVGPPSNAKSVLTVGSVGHGTSAHVPSWFTSPGPTEDGRLKPTVAAQGEGTVSAASDAVLGTNNCASCSLDGSSMSAPTAAGLAALVREYFASGFHPSGTRTPADGFSPTGALVKAILVDGAVALGPGAPGPDFESGYGRILLDGTLPFAGSPSTLRVDDRREGLVTGGVVTHAYDVSAGSPLRATLAWSDRPGDLLAATPRVNVLKLEVVDPSGTTWFQTVDAGTGLPRQTSNPAEPHDGWNVEERLVFPSPAPGRWVVRVRAVDVPLGPQPFALVVRGALADCPAPGAPAAPVLSTPADHQVLVTWPAVAGASSYTVSRSLGGCPGAAWVPIATVPGLSYLDTGVSGGTTWSYRVAAASDPQGDCASPPSPCASVVPTGDCFLAPGFSGLRSAVSAGLAGCTVRLTWDPGLSYCGSDVRYNVYRGASDTFVPGPSNRIARCLTATGWDDSVDLVSGIPSWYVVRAEDASTGHGGPCRDGNEDANTIRRAGVPDGPPTTGTWTDDAGDTGPAEFLTPAPWMVASVGGNAGPKVYTAASSSGICADLTSPVLTLADPGTGPQLTFATKHDLDYDPTGEIFGRQGSLGQVEIATAPSFSSWTRVPLTPNYPAPIDFPYNACPTTQGVANYFSGTDLSYRTYVGSLANWAGGDVKVRFHLSGDFLYSGGSWWVDDVAVSQALVPGTCSTLAAGPPPVPDGAIVPGEPVRVSRSGSSVLVTWDAAQCPAAAVNVYRGPIGSYATFTGGFCNLPPTGSATLAMPDGSWFLVAATDGAAIDGSYGRTVDGAERTYDGASAACPGITRHVTNNGCP